MIDEIAYGDIMDLGFEEEFIDDEIFFDQYGYRYSIVSKKLTKKLELDWDKQTRICKLLRMDSESNIRKSIKIKNLDDLKEIIDFFTD